MAEISRRKFVKLAGVGCAGVALAGFSGCAGGPSTTVADTVVYGKVYTSNASQEYASAFAVKDGKYVYVGDEDGAKSYIKDGTTKVVDYRDKGLVMAGATEGHGHYVMAGAVSKVTIEGATQDEILANIKEHVEKNPDKSVYFTFGWDEQAMKSVKETIEMRSKLDEICRDKAMLLGDNTGHNAFFNSKAAEIAGITKDTVITGGTFSKGADGELLGLASDLAMNYLLKYAISTERIIQESDYEDLAKTMEDSLHSYGYIYYQDGWTNYFDTQFLELISQRDKGAGLSVVVSGTYKIDSYDDWKAELAKAEEYSEKYSTDRFKYSTLKLFADGEAVESMSGWIIDGYANGTYGAQVWDDETMNSMVKAANEAGLSVHVHSQGDAATNQAVNAFVNAESSQKGRIYNGIAHGRNITEDAKKKMGEHHIYAAENINWRVLHPKENAYLIDEIFAKRSTFEAGYPIKSLIDKGVNVSSSTDVPAAAGAPTTVPGIIEVAVNDTRGDFEACVGDSSELVSVEQAMDIMTINGRQLQIEDERGSIETGKYADFVFINKDISTCAKNEIHEGEVKTVYFEGREVYTA